MAVQGAFHTVQEEVAWAAAAVQIAAGREYLEEDQRVLRVEVDPGAVESKTVGSCCHMDYREERHLGKVALVG